MKRKSLFIIIGILIVIALVYLAIDINKKSKVTPQTSLIDFSIDDTAAVTKIVVYNSFTNLSYTVTREKEEKWYGPENACVQQSIPKMMLTTFKDVTLKGYVPKSAMENMKRILMSQYKKVSIYKDGDWVKTWYVGQSTQDHLGTYMLLETPERKSDNPVIMGMKGFHGILKPRFVADARKFQCTKMFDYKRENIQSIQVINHIQPNASFLIQNNGQGNYQVKSQGKVIPDYNKDNLIFYLNGFKNFHFYGPNYVLNKQQIDSIKKQSPDYELKIKAKESNYDLKLYRRPNPKIEQPQDSVIYDLNFLWGILNNGKLVEMQYYGVGPLIRGKMIFSNVEK